MAFDSFAAWVPMDRASPFLTLPRPLDQFRSDYDYALRDGWDGPGSAALTPEVLRSANDLLDYVGMYGHVVEVSPGRDGSLAFTWEDDSGNHLYVDVGPYDAVHVAHAVNCEAPWERVFRAEDDGVLESLNFAIARFARPQMVFSVRGS